MLKTKKGNWIALRGLLGMLALLQLLDWDSSLRGQSQGEANILLNWLIQQGFAFASVLSFAKLLDLGLLGVFFWKMPFEGREVTSITVLAGLCLVYASVVVSNYGAMR